MLALIHIFGRFYSEAARDASECLIGGAWSWGAIEDGAVQRSVITRSTLPIWWSLEAAVPHDADSATGAPELIDHSPGNHDSADNDVALLYREHAVDRQEPVGVDAHPVR